MCFSFFFSKDKIKPEKSEKKEASNKMIEIELIILFIIFHFAFIVLM